MEYIYILYSKNKVLIKQEELAISFIDYVDRKIFIKKNYDLVPGSLLENRITIKDTSNIARIRE